MVKEKNGFLTFVIAILMGILLAINYSLFIVPNNFAPAGINGIAVMVQYKLHFSVGYMSLIINVPLCIIAYFKYNKNFAVKTLLTCISYSASYLFLQKTGILKAFIYDAKNTDTIYPILIAGMVIGFIYGILFSQNACSGGTDIISKLIGQKYQDLNFFWITFSLNAVVAGISYFVYAENQNGQTVFNLKPVCLCILYCFIASYVGNLMMENRRTACEFVIVTEHPAEIEKEIISRFHHSATRISASGIYSGTEKTMLICIINKHQVRELEEMVSKFPNTFSFQNKVNGTVGNFKQIPRNIY